MGWSRPEDWPWSSFGHHFNGECGVVEIESRWTARKRERRGIFPMVKLRAPAKKPGQAEPERGALENTERKPMRPVIFTVVKPEVIEIISIP
jgi:hypothetical protein